MVRRVPKLKYYNLFFVTVLTADCRNTFTSTGRRAKERVGVFFLRHAISSIIG